MKNFTGYIYYSFLLTLSGRLYAQNTAPVEVNNGNGGTLFIIIISFLLVSILSFLFFKKGKQVKELREKLDSYEKKYSGIINLDEEVEKRNTELSKINSQISSLKEKYIKASEAYKELEHQSNLLQENLEIADYGMYEPYFDFETSEKFKEVIKEIRDEQKKIIKGNLAILGGEKMTFNGSLKEGQKMVNKQKKLMLRAFNGECDGFISNVNWSNEKRYEERIIKSFEAINKTAETEGIEITQKYANLKLKELRLSHEYKLKKQQEKEEQQAIKEQMREEEKARKDFEKAQKEAEKEEKLLREAMKKAQEEVAKASEEERAQFESKLLELQEQVKEAEEKGKRAISMAQQTKTGHVYVISNIGSFGENVYKIGMTRRLEPMDRVNELGDASVPFKFDVHAFIKSENAPELENKLHKVFDKNRLNHVNLRREFFNISLEEIEKVVNEKNGEIEFVKVPEAKEYRESLAIKRKMNSSQNEKDENKNGSVLKNPDELFS